MNEASARERLSEAEARLDPEENRDRAITELEGLFAQGGVPDPPLGGFVPGRLLTTTIWGPADRVVRRGDDLWKPWLGKWFDPASGRGINVVDAAARIPMLLAWPSYRPRPAGPDRLDAFGFRTRTSASETEADLKVLKLEYDVPVNPRFVIRRVVDEVVQIDDGLYLGRILYRVGEVHHPIGFFALERAERRR